MGLKKFKNLFIKSSKTPNKKLKLATSTNQDQKVEPSTENHKPRNKDNNREKAQIEQLQKAISTKLKDPAMAKKAAQIIEELLKEKLP